MTPEEKVRDLAIRLFGKNCLPYDIERVGSKEVAESQHKAKLFETERVLREALNDQIEACAVVADEEVLKGEDVHVFCSVKIAEAIRELKG